jgi:enamine deaminase RidA (YjgF/YER057c/UK114 family)
MIRRFQSGKRMSHAVVCNGMVFLSGQVADNTRGSLQEQTRDVLTKIERLLAEAGSGKSKLLCVYVYLPHITDFAAMNEVYDAWIDPQNPPARACTEARLADPDLRIEIVAIAEA